MANGTPAQRLDETDEHGKTEGREEVRPCLLSCRGSAVWRSPRAEGPWPTPLGRHLMDLVTIAAYNSTPEAQLAKNLLEAEGISAFLTDDATADMLHLTSPFGEAKIQVTEENVARAVAILRAAEQQHAEAVARAETGAEEDEGPDAEGPEVDPDE